MVRADQRLALFEAQISVFLRLDAGGHHHGGAAVVDDVVDLALERGLVDRQVGRERRQRRDDQAGRVLDILGHFHRGFPGGGSSRENISSHPGFATRASHFRLVSNKFPDMRRYSAQSRQWLQRDPEAVFLSLSSIDCRIEAKELLGVLLPMPLFPQNRRQTSRGQTHSRQRSSRRHDHRPWTVQQAELDSIRETNRRYAHKA